MLNEQQTQQSLLTSEITEEVIFSAHAQARIKQRGIKKSWLALLLEYGHYIYQSGKHSYTVSLDKTGIKKIKQTYGDLVELNKLRRMYVVLSEDSAVITCAYR